MSPMVGTIRKWYDKLSFPKEYNEHFEKLLHRCGEIDGSTLEFGNDGGLNLLICLYRCEALERRYAEKGISEEILLDTMHDIVLWTVTHFGLYGELGVSETNWLKRHFNMELFKLGRLQFCMEQFQTEIDEITVIHRGDNVLGVHIARGEPLDVDACNKSFHAAKAFFQRYFPQFLYDYFVCTSWLLDNTSLPNFLKEDSNILQFGKLFNIIAQKENYDILRFTINWGIDKATVKNFKPTNRFTERIINSVLDGGKFYYGIGYIDKNKI